MATASTTQTLGERQLAIYLAQQGIDPQMIPTGAMKDIIATACATVELTSMRNSQAMVMYMGIIKSYSAVVADYCTKPVSYRTTRDQAICDILKTHGVLPALE
jgi:hypothetical protein